MHSFIFNEYACVFVFLICILYTYIYIYITLYIITIQLVIKLACFPHISWCSNDMISNNHPGIFVTDADLTLPALFPLGIQSAIAVCHQLSPHKQSTSLHGYLFTETQIWDRCPHNNYYFTNRFTNVCGWWPSFITHQLPACDVDIFYSQSIINT